MFAGGVAAGDYDGDGDVDLYVVRGNIGPNLLYRNDGGNVFTDVAAAAGVDHAAPGGGGFLHSGPGLRRHGRRRRPRPVRRRHRGRSLPPVRERRRRHVHRRHRGVRRRRDGREEHDFRVVRRLRPRWRPRHDDGALGHAASSGRLRGQWQYGVALAQRQRRERHPVHQRERRSRHRRDDHRAARRLSRIPAGRARLRLHVHAGLRAHGRGPVSRHPERGGLQQLARLHEQWRERRHRDLPRRDGQRRADRPQWHGRCGRRHRQRRRPRLVRQRDLRLQRDGRKPALSERRRRRAFGRDGRCGGRGRRLGLGRLLRGFQSRRAARHLPHERLGVESDR